MFGRNGRQIVELIHFYDSKFQEQIKKEMVITNRSTIYWVFAMSQAACQVFYICHYVILRKLYKVGITPILQRRLSESLRIFSRGFAVSHWIGQDSIISLSDFLLTSLDYEKNLSHFF